MGTSFPGESAEYRAARERLLQREIELRRLTEAVAAARRELPPGGAVPEDYVFRGTSANGAEADIRMSELFAPGKDSLPRILAHARERGWRHLRLLSSAGNTYNRDYFGETSDGTQQLPMLNVFRRDGHTIRHFWGSELMFGPSDPDQDPRHGDTIDPLWNLFDFLPEGR